MRRLLVAVPLVLLGGCQVLDPALQLQAAARQLHFTLERVEPGLDLAFPLDRSRLRLRLDLGVDNPSGVHLRTRSVSGDLHLLVQGVDHPIGTVTFPQGLDLVPGGRSTLHAELAFSYGDLRNAWGPLSGVVLHHAPATWTLAGEARFDLAGISFGVPFRARTTSGS